MLDAIVVTLAVGPKYVAMAADLLASFAIAGNTTLVVTDDPMAFGSDTITIPYIDDGAYIWHAKRHAVRAGLERAYTVYFIDADFRPREHMKAEVPKLQRIEPGLSGPSINSLGKLQFHWMGNVDSKLPHNFYNLTQEHFGLSDWREWTWFGDCLFSVSQDDGDSMFRFVDAWDRYVEWSIEMREQLAEKKDEPWALMAFCDGVAMACSARIGGWEPEMKLSLFTYIRRAFNHDLCGNWRLPRLKNPSVA